MNILVIHPLDPTTDCLNVIYRDRKDCDVIRDPGTSWEEIAEAIKSHDEIICLGHGTPDGLLAYANGNRFGRYIVDYKHARLFENKRVWSIWCNSDSYFHNVSTSTPGIHTGMIVSELSEEQYVFGYLPLSLLEMDQNMKVFCEAFRDNFDLENPKEAQRRILEIYTGEDKVTSFNRDRILVF